MSSRNSKDKRRIRRKLEKRAHGICPRCGARAPLTLDHRIPLSRGGSWKRKNLQLLCKKCNAEKGNRMPWEF